MNPNEFAAEDKDFVRLDINDETPTGTRRVKAMPEIARFYGIIIQIHFNREHNPPHFHALYGEREGVFDIRSLSMLQGDLPPKAQALVKEWAGQYRDELLRMWETKQLQKLKPLE